jgi:mRNA interferase RelE/StbE
MCYALEWSSHARRALRLLPGEAQRRIALAVDALTANPRPPGSRKLQGHVDTYRLRAGEYRVLYRVLDAVLVVLVVEVGHRKTVYKGR